MRSSFQSLEWGFIDVFALAGGVSILAALMSLTLPHTPPAKESSDPLAFTKAFALLRDPNYRVFFIIALIVATELPLYYVLTFPFLQSAGGVVGITSENLPSWMTIAQIAEIFTIAFMLPAVLPIWGVRRTMLLGIFAWPRGMRSSRWRGQCISRRPGRCGWRSRRSRCTAFAMCSSSWWRSFTPIWSPRAMCARLRRR